MTYSCFVSVDGTDFRIWEPTPFSASWHSHKFNGAAVRYEVVVAIHSGDIVAINGPFRAGDWPDIAIFRDRTMGMLLEGERVEADDGYRGEAASIDLPGECLGDQEDGFVAMWIQRRRKGLVRARHETVNRRFKQFNCLSRIFRHDVSKHSYCFRAVVVMTQLGIDFGEFIWELPFEYNTR